MILSLTIPASLVGSVIVGMVGPELPADRVGLVALFDLLKFLTGGLLGILGTRVYDKRRNGNGRNGAGGSEEHAPPAR